MSTTTQKEIAKSLNVSVMTVSKAFRGHPDISPTTRRRVIEQGKRLRYIPNILAKGLAAKRTKMVSFVASDISYNYEQRIVSGVMSVLEEHGYLSVIGMTAWNLERERREVDLMLGRRVEAMICSPLIGSEETYRRIVDMGIPLVFVGSRLDIPELSWVSLDGADAVRKMMKHLLELGHRKIAFVSPDTVKESISLRVRLETYKQVLVSRGIEVRNELIGLGLIADPTSITQATEKLMALPEPPTAILAITDIVGYQVMDSLMHQGYRIPRDISLAGIGDLGPSAYNMISLTTVTEDAFQIGKLAGKIVLHQLHEKTVSPTHKLMQGPLVVRRSTGPPENNK